MHQSRDNHRQGISIIDARNLLLENCVFRNCLFENNAGHGMFVRANDYRDEKREPISILFENCVARMSQPYMGSDCGMCVRVPGDVGPKGTIEFINCLSENMGQAGANVYGLSVGCLKIRFVNCNWINSQGTAVVLNMQRPSANGTGSVEFVNCSVYEEKTEPAVQVITLAGNDYGDDINGVITVHNELGARIASEPRGVTVNLRVVDSKSATP